MKKIIIKTLLFIGFILVANEFFKHYALRTPIKIKVEFQSPIYKIKRIEIKEEKREQKKKKSARLGNPTPTPTPKWKLLQIGKASFYTVDGCLGCNPERIMANGEKLRDDRLTVALLPSVVKKYKLLNKFIKIRNNKTGKEVIVRVTDTGGFKKYGRIADLSLATKNALGCGGICEIEIWIKNEEKK